MKSLTKRFVRSRTRRVLVVFAGVLCVAGASAYAAGAFGSGDTMVTYGPDHFKVKWSAISGSTVFTSQVLTVTCRANGATGPDIGPGPDIGLLAMNPPTFQSCTDNLGGTDTVTVNQSGWTFQLLSENTDPACDSGTGNDEATDADCVVIGVPANSTTITSTASLACGGTITTTPGAGENVGASVTDTGTTPTKFKLTNQPVPFQCGVVTGTAQFNGTYTLKAPDAGVLADDS
jgi:hypothetical protein